MSDHDYHLTMGEASASGKYIIFSKEHNLYFDEYIQVFKL